MQHRINKLQKLLKSLRAKLLDADTREGKKVAAIGGRGLAVRQLKEKNPKIKWDEIIPSPQFKQDKEDKKPKIKKSIDWSDWILQKKLEAREENLKKHNYTAISDGAIGTHKAKLILEVLEKASKKQLMSMIGADSSAAHHQEAVNKIRGLFPNSSHDVWLTKHIN